MFIIFHVFGGRIYKVTGYFVLLCRIYRHFPVFGLFKKAFLRLETFFARNVVVSIQSGRIGMTSTKEDAVVGLAASFVTTVIYLRRPCVLQYLFMAEPVTSSRYIGLTER